jgi:O-antigen/teichoic acid export membrane protein
MALAAREEPGALRRLLSSSALYALTGAAQQGTGFLLIPVYTRLIAPTDYGVLELLNAFLSLAMMCLTLGLGSAINKVYHRDCHTTEQREAVVATALLAILPVVLGLGVLVFTLAAPMSRVLTGADGYAGLLRIAVCSSVCYALFALLLNGFRAEERTGAYCSLSVVQFSLALVFNLVLVVGWRLGVRGVLIGTLLANGTALVVGVSLLGVGRLRFDRRLVGPLVAFGAAIVPSMLAGWVMDVSDRYLLRLFRDLDEVAQYAVGYKFGLAVQLLVTWPFQLAWPAVAFRISKDAGHERTYARVLTYLVLLLTLVLLGLVAVSENVLPWVVGREYAFGCTVVPVIAAAYALNALQYCVSPGIHIAGRTRSLSLIGIASAVANLGLGVVLIPSFGILGAAWATLIAYALALTGALWLSQRSHPIAYEGGRLARIAVAGSIAFGLLQLLAADGAGVWTLAKQLGILSAFVALVTMSGFVTHEERAYVRGLWQRVGRS